MIISDKQRKNHQPNLSLTLFLLDVSVFWFKKSWILQMLWIWLPQWRSMQARSMNCHHLQNLYLSGDNPHHFRLWEHEQLPLREYHFPQNLCRSFCRIWHCPDLLYRNLDISWKNPINLNCLEFCLKEYLTFIGPVPIGNYQTVHRQRYPISTL